MHRELMHNVPLIAALCAFGLIEALVPSRLVSRAGSADEIARRIETMRRAGIVLVIVGGIMLVLNWIGWPP